MTDDRVQPGSLQEWREWARRAPHPPDRGLARGRILEWIVQARRPETRSRRVAETAESASRNERANEWCRP